MYSIQAYGGMINDKVRVQAFADALRQAVTPDSVVLDIGTGTGFFALLACKYGARRVFAIEPADAIRAAQEMAVANGYADRMVFYQEKSQNVTLPEKANLIISDIRGALPLVSNHIETIVDARKRLLAPGGVLIPRRDIIRVAPAESESAFDKWAKPWLDSEYGFNMRAGYNYVINTWFSARVEANALLAEPQTWIEIDYQTVEQTDFAGQLVWIAARDGVVHGFTVWFDLETAPGIGFSNEPGVPDHPVVYGAGFFPLQTPVTVAHGDQIILDLSIRLINGQYIWIWNTQIVDEAASATTKASFRQSTYNASPLSSSFIHNRASAFVPSLKERGEVIKLTLNLMDGTRSLEEISSLISATFPAKYATWHDALPEVGLISEKYSR